MPLTPGTRLGVYEVTAPLGEGGMGQVWRARDTRLNRDVALKVLPDSFANDPDCLARFTREAQTLAALNHPNIAHIHGLEESGGLRALVMELVEGEDLSQRIARGAIPLDEALPIAKQVADALEAAHDQGIVHRDLKPANIKVRADGTVKVLDFGLAKAIEPGSAIREPGAGPMANSPTITTPAMTQAGMILGTAAYMSPEQARGRPVDKRSDVWAFGAVLFEMLAGRRPFDGEDATDVIAAVVKTTPDWAALPAAVPRPIVVLIQRCLEKDRKARVGDLAVARFVLADAAAIGTAPPGAGEAAATGRASRAPILAWTIAGGALLAAIATWAMSRATSDPVAPVEPLYASIAPPAGVRAAFDRGFALSPDGRWLAFTARDERGQTLLWIRDMRTGESEPINGTSDAAFPFWSPDSKHVAFWSERRIKRVNVAEGVPQVVADAPAAAILFRGGTWMEDDTIVFSDSANLLSRVSASGGPAQRIEGIPAVEDIVRMLYPRGLGGSRALLVGIEYRDSARSGIYRIDVSRPDATTRLVETSVNSWATLPLGPRRIAWMTGQVLGARAFDGISLGPDAPLAVATGVGNTVGWTLASASADGERMVLGMQEGRGGSTRALWMRRDGTTQSVAEVTSQATYRLAPDGQRVAVTRGNDVWVIDTSKQLATRVTTTPESESQPIWSPDGRRLAYRHIGVPDLFIVDLTTSLTDRHASVLPASSFVGVDWSPDGRRLVFSAATGDRASNLDLLVYDLASRQSMPLTTTPFNEMHPRFSPDGRAVAYTSDETGAREVYVRALDSAASRRLSTAGGEFPMWRHDSRELVFVSPTGVFMSVPMRHGAEPAGDPVALFTANPVRSLTDQARFDMAADGQRFLVNPEPAPAPLVLIEHWRPAAAAPAPAATVK